MAASPIVEPKRRGTSASADAGNSPDAIPFDFRDADVLSADQLRSVQSVYSNFARSLAAALSAFLRTYVSGDVERIEQTSFRGFSEVAGSSASLLPLKMRPLESPAVLGVSQAVLFPLLEILLGGAGKPSAILDRELTDIEKSLLEPLIRVVLQELKSAWQPLIPLEFALESSDASRRVRSAMPRNEGLIAVTVELRLPEAAGVLHVGLPSRAIRQLLPSSQPAKPDASADEQSKILSLAGRAEVDANACLNGPRMLFQDLLNIEAGDVIALDCPLGQELDLELNGVPKFKGHLVTRGGKRAFQIKRELPSPRA
jgi:flagellar motor switch protein FliM